jgi:hypothetical protein
MQNRTPNSMASKDVGQRFLYSAVAAVVILVVFAMLAHPQAHGYIKTLSHCKSRNIDPNWIKHMAEWSDFNSPRAAKGFTRSQGSQDIFLDKIFTVIGHTNRFFVEFGFNEPSYSSNVSGANTWKLYDEGWRGLLLDGGNENPTINLHRHFLFASNIVQLFEQYKVPKELDYLSCDMDSHDLFVLEAILRAGYRPRVITTEYNSNYPLDLPIAMLDPEMLSKDVSNFDFKFAGCAWGASAAALKIVADEYGYTMVGRVLSLDLIWLRDDLIDPQWHVPAFEWFFRNHSWMGALHQHPQQTRDILERLVDYAHLSRTGDMQASIASAKSLLQHARLKCFEKIFS